MRDATNAGISFVAVGDIQVTHPFIEAMESGGPAFTDLLSMLRGADITLGNLEAPLSTKGYPIEKMIALRSHPSLMADIARLGLDVSTLANNHAMDYGYDALAEFMELLDSHRLPHVGTGRNLHEAMSPVILERKGVRVAFLGMASTLVHGSGAGPERPGIAPVRAHTAYEVETSLVEEQPGTPPYIKTWMYEEDMEYAASRVREARALADAVVVTIHWGVAFKPTPEEYQKQLGHALIDAGADMIVGHHAHTFQPVEIYKDRPIFYGISNFLFHYQIPEDIAEQAPGDNRWEMSPLGVIIQGEIAPGRPPDLTLLPVNLDSAGHPHLASAESGAEILGRLDALSRRYGCRVTMVPGANRGRISTTED